MKNPRTLTLSLEDELEREELAFAMLSPELRARLRMLADRRERNRNSVCWSVHLFWVLSQHGFHRAAATLLYSLAVHSRISVMPREIDGDGPPPVKRRRRRKAAKNPLPASGA